jgi:hypothetical protein
MYFSASNGRAAQASKGQGNAYDLAEAGINEALAILNGALTPMQSNLLPSTVRTYPTGTATFSGALSGTTWTITSTGAVKNPSGAADLKRTLTRTVTVYGIASGASVSAWSRMYQDSASSCLTITDVTITMPISTRGNMCLEGSAKITGSETTVDVGGNVVMSNGSSGSPEENAGAGSTTGTGTAWSSTGNIVSSNNSDATVSLSGSGSSRYLDASSFGFSIPSNATITGIVLEIERSASSSSRARDDEVYLLKGGSSSGITDKASSTTWGTSDSTRSYGSSSDTWGTTWTPANINASNFGARLKVRNVSSSSVTANVDYISIRVYYSTPPDTRIGASGSPIAKAHVGGTCKYDTQSAHSPCTSTDKVWASEINSTPENLTKPQVDLAYWYEHAQPGPKQYCTTGSFPNGFDNDSTRNNSVPGNGEITPENYDYTCQVKDAGNNLIGELSWNRSTRVLKIKGTIFIDGNFRFDDDGNVTHYQGRGIIYASGQLEFDELVCAGGSGNTSCVTQSGGMASWDPSQNMMIVLSQGGSEFDQGGTQAQSVPSGLQGLIYSNGTCTVHENFHLSGPIVCNRIDMPSASNGWPTYYYWPPLGTLVDGQVYMTPETADEHLLVLGPQSG